MKHTLFLLTLLISSYASGAAPHEDLATLLNALNFDSTMTLARTYLAQDAQDASACSFIGEVCFEWGRYDSAFYYLQKTLDLDKEKTLISCWAHSFLGRYYFVKGDKAQAKKELNQSINKRATGRMKDYSRYWIKVMGLDGFYDNWKTTETEHYIFHFQDSTDVGDITHFVKLYEEAYTVLGPLFHASFPKKMDYYVWKDRSDAQKHLHSIIGFTRPDIFVAHIHRSQTRGHELTHALSYWAWGLPVKHRDRFTNEGISVAFDLANDDKYAEAKKALDGIYLKDVLSMWQSPDVYSDNALYPIAGIHILPFQTRHRRTIQKPCQRPDPGKRSKDLR